jgi:hypothetical protein
MPRLVDEITYVKAAEATDVATQSAILGPFFREDHPVRQKGDSISFNTPKDAEVSTLHPRRDWIRPLISSHRPCTCTAKFWTR